MTCLQQNVFVLDMLGEHLPLTLLIDLISFLLRLVVFISMICLKFVFLRIAIVSDR